MEHPLGFGCNSIAAAHPAEFRVRPAGEIDDEIVRALRRFAANRALSTWILIDDRPEAMHWVSRQWQGISLAVIAVATAAVYWPALRSGFVLDDFFLYAIALNTGNPLSLFVHSHFPGSYFYRPLGMAFWWLSEELFGHAPRPHYAVNLALHIGVAWALWRVLILWTQARLPALLCALAFALHPIAIGTSLWLADRFDLLAALFTLLAVAAAWNYADSGRRGALIAAFALATLAALAKEIGFSAFVPIALIWAWPLAAPAASFWTRERRAAGCLAVLALLLLVWRRWLIGDMGTQAVLGDTPLWRELLEGFYKWSVGIAVYVSGIAREGHLARVVESVCGSLLVGFFATGLMRERVRRSEWIALCAAAGFVVATILLQAPVLRAMPSTLGVASSAQTVATWARLLYLSLAGILLFVGVLWNVAARAFVASRWMPRAAAFAALGCMIPWAIDAHGLARGYRRESLLQAKLAETALAAVVRNPAIRDHCEVHFLDMEKALSASDEFVFSMQIDAAIKTLASPAQAYLQTCRFQTNRTPWFYVARRGALTFDNVAPMQPVYLEGKLAPWLEYGDAEIAYLNLQDYIDPKSMTSAHFLRYANGDFVDVTADVLAGRIEVKFRCGRRASQCVLPEGTLLAK